MTDEQTQPGSAAADSLPKKNNGKPFAKGYDPRRNLKGTPPDALTMRKFIRKIAAEIVNLKDDYGDGETTRLYLMLRRMFSSNQPKDREMVMKMLAPGLLKDEHEVNNTGDTRVIIEYADSKNNLATPAPGAGEDQE